MSAQVTAARAHPTGFVMIDNSVIDTGDLSPNALSLYVILARHVNRETGLAFPSLDRLCKLARMARATVVKYLKELEHKGWIQVIRGFKPGSKERAVNRYRVLDQPAAEADEESSSGRELSRSEANEHAAGGSSRFEPGVVHEMNEGSSTHEQRVVHALNGNQIDHEQNQLNQTELNQEGPALCAVETQHDTASEIETDPPIQASSRKKIQWEEFCKALADVCQIDFEANQGKIRKAASRLWKKGKGYTAADVKTFRQWWYRQDWRGQKGDLPTLQNVVELIRAAVEDPTLVQDGTDTTRYLQGTYADIIEY